MAISASLCGGGDRSPDFRARWRARGRTGPGCPVSARCPAGSGRRPDRWSTPWKRSRGRRCRRRSRPPRCGVPLAPRILMPWARAACASRGQRDRIRRGEGAGGADPDAQAAQRVDGAVLQRFQVGLCLPASTMASISSATSQCGAGQRTGNGEPRRPEGVDGAVEDVAGDGPQSGLEPDQAAGRGRDADRPTAVVAGPERAACPAATAAASPPLEPPAERVGIQRVAGGWRHVVLRMATQPELRNLGLAQRNRAGPRQRGHQR